MFVGGGEGAVQANGLRLVVFHAGGERLDGSERLRTKEALEERQRWCGDVIVHERRGKGPVQLLPSSARVEQPEHGAVGDSRRLLIVVAQGDTTPDKLTQGILERCPRDLRLVE
ncbi:MAG: hypothetical protein M5U28_14010 [Sandaracinaceae bacterium]|nr:hypothetical protein [Sandaracinaceae bacterium]